MGIFTGQMVYREQIQKKYGEPMLSELDNIYASFSTALKDIVATKESTVTTKVIQTVLDEVPASTSNYTTSFTQIANTITTGEDLLTIALKNTQLTRTGHLARVVVWGDSATTTQNTAWRIKLNGTQIITTDAIGTRKGWRLECFIARTGSATQDVFAQVHVSDEAASGRMAWFTTDTETFANDIDLTINVLTNHIAGNFTIEGYSVEYITNVDASSLSGALSASAGGTGFSSYTIGDLLYADTTTSLAKVGVGASGTIVRSNGTLPVYSTSTIVDTFTRGSFPVATTANTLTALAIGSAGKILRSDGTDIVYSTLTIPDTAAISTLLYASSANVLAALATANSGVLITSGTGVPSISSTIPSATQDNITRLGVIATLLEASAVIRTSNDVSSYLQLGRYQAGDPYGYVSVSPTLTDIGLKFETRASDISSTKALITGAGAFQFSAGTETLPSISFLDDVDTGFWINPADTERLNFSAAGTGRLQFGASGIKIAAAREVGWASGSITNTAADVRLLRDGPALLALRNSTNPQEFRIYNSDGASIDEFVSLGFLNTANVFTIETEQAGGGVVRPIAFMGGSVGIGTTTFPSAGTSGLIFGDGTALSGMGTNTAGLFADNVGTTVEMFAIDELGAATQISPHGFKLFEPDDIEPYPWSYYSKNEYLGIEINVDICKLARLVQNLTGQQVIYHNNIGGTRDWVDHQEYNMRRQMESYERWEVTEPEDGQAKPPAPSLPQLKQPPLWLKKRLSAKGLLNVEKAKVLATALTAWKQERHL